MNFYIVIPAHNEERYLRQTLASLTSQTLSAKKIVIVNDHSTDGTQKILDTFSADHSNITSITISSEENHSPGSKVINAFYKGLEQLDDQFDVICKFDADLIFPKNYLKEISEVFLKNPKCGMAGGFCYIETNNEWVLENLTNKDHIRGALKAYRKECFGQIGGLKRTMGWDTVDELLAQYNQWEITTCQHLHVKHLKPTGYTYDNTAKLKQGQAFKRMRYGFWLTLIASAKLAVKKKSLGYFWNCMRGYCSLRSEYIVSREEGVFIRKLRWSNIKNKLF